MFDSVLFTAGNRALGSAIGDFSLYGGQSEHGAPMGDTRHDEVSLHGAEPPAASAAPVAAAAAPGALDTGGPVANASAQIPFMLSSAIAPIQLPVVETNHDLATVSIDLTQGSGGPIPGHAGFAALEHAGSAIASAGEAAQPLAFLTQGSGGLATPLLDVDHAAPALVAPVLVGVEELAPGLVSPVLDTAGTLFDAASDTLSDLAGTNPLGGVATLVSLVSVTDLFDIHAVDSGTPEPLPDLGLGVLDSLTVDGPSDSLLGAGDHHHDDGGLGHILDHPLGL